MYEVKQSSTQPYLENLYVKKEIAHGTQLPFIGFTLVWLFALTAYLLFLKKEQQSRHELSFPFNPPDDSIPCRHCQFFNNNAYLKCAVRPTAVMRKLAIDCMDYQARSSATPARQRTLY